MKIHNSTSSVLGLLFVCCCLLASAVDGQSTDHKSTSLTVRQFELPKIFDFKNYVQIYGKHYRAPAEWINRARLFVAKVQVVFIQGIKYLHRLADKYFALNAMSDWTAEERLASFGFRPNKVDLVAADSVRDIVGLDLKTIKRKNEDDQQTSPSKRSHRSRRDVEQHQKIERHLSADNLMRKPDQIEDESSMSLHDNSEVKNDEPIDEIENKSLVGSLMDGLSQYWLDQTQETNLLSKAAAAASSTKTVRSEPVGKDEVFLDYRDTGCMATVKSQSRCGSCYIFSAIALYEYHHCVQTGVLVDFSEQYPVDCGMKYGLNGCAGGQPEEVGNFVDKFGLESRDYYPYKAEDRTCPYNVNTEYELMGRLRVAKDSSVICLSADYLENDVIQFMLETKGPLSFAIGVNDEFADYGGGIDKLGDYESISGHAMVLIGHGRQDGHEYWLIRNSHGLSWGEKGHYKLDKDSNRKHVWQIDLIQAKFETNPKHDVQKTKQSLYKNSRLSEKLISWINPFYGV